MDESECLDIVAVDLLAPFVFLLMLDAFFAYHMSATHTCVHTTHGLLHPCTHTYVHTHTSRHNSQVGDGSASFPPGPRQSLSSPNLGGAPLHVKNFKNIDEWEVTSEHRLAGMYV